MKPPMVPVGKNLQFAFFERIVRCNRFPTFSWSEKNRKEKLRGTIFEMTCCHLVFRSGGFREAADEYLSMRNIEIPDH